MFPSPPKIFYHQSAHTKYAHIVVVGTFPNQSFVAFSPLQSESRVAMADLPPLPSDVYYVCIAPKKISNVQMATNESPWHPDRVKLGETHPKNPGKPGNIVLDFHQNFH